MKFGRVPISQSLDSILAHSLSLPDGKRIRKGTLIDCAIIQQLEAAGFETVMVASPDTDNILEDKAADLIANAITGASIRRDEANTGRVNFFATENGVFNVSRNLIDAMNAIDPAITIATLENQSEVNQGRIIATIKIIPYAVEKTSLDAVLAMDIKSIFSVLPYKANRVGLISTQLPSIKPSVHEKTKRNLEKRLGPSGSKITRELYIDHDEDAISNAVNQIIEDVDMIILFGASAISDVKDVVPAGIKQAEGKIIRFGMPVDPGNLLLLAELNHKPVLGAPGCARSFAENGFDWVLQRLLSGSRPHDIKLASMGVGGLLMETGARPHSRIQPEQTSSHIAAIILAAGQSRRMGAENKMTVPIKGKPMVRHVADATGISAVKEIIVVTGHKPNEVLSVLSGVEYSQAHNSDFEEGLSTSLKAGISALPDQTSHAIVMLGDMPFITSDMIEQMIGKSNQNPDKIIMATHEGKRGNPVIWPSNFFEELKNIHGDIGARHIIAENSDLVVEVELGSAASLDLDTPQVIANLLTK